MKRLLLGVIVLGLAACSDPNVGGECTATGDCDDGLTCDTVPAGGYCTKACTTPGEQAECPDGSICDAVIGTQMSCVKVCSKGEDCRPDQDCNGITGSNIKACKPKT
jgi:hypothetical protein